MAADGTAMGGRPRPLDGIEVLDVTDAFGAYAGRLLAGLGAHVTRVVPPGGDPLAREWPLVTNQDGSVASAYQWFVNIDKDFVTLDLGEPTARAEFERRLDSADILLESWGVDPAASNGYDRERLRERHPRLVVVSITPFGVDGPRAGDEATDLIALAAGGLLSLGGYADSEPIATPGQARLAASIFGAAAAIMGLIGRDADGRGRTLDVAAQEVVAAALEDAIPQFDLTGVVRRRAGDTPREAGTGVYRCADGYVSMVAGRLGTAKAWRALVAWLAEDGPAEARLLLEPEWDSFAHRQKPGSIRTFIEIFERFTATRTKEDLYAEAQRRDIALAPVNEVSEVLHDEQLAARQFFVPLDVPGDEQQQMLVPSRPYRLNGDQPYQPALASSSASPSREQHQGSGEPEQTTKQAPGTLSGIPAAS
jgi:benzylsuccinate CoA-transferase BbsE subunit